MSTRTDTLFPYPPLFRSKVETRTPEFLAHINPVGRIPVLQVGQRFLPESNAACCYLGEGSALVPGDRFGRADMLRWMFFEQYHHEPNVATVRYWLTRSEEHTSELQSLLRISYAVFCLKKKKQYMIKVNTSQD